MFICAGDQDGEEGGGVFVDHFCFPSGDRMYFGDSVYFCCSLWWQKAKVNKWLNGSQGSRRWRLISILHWSCLTTTKWFFFLTPLAISQSYDSMGGSSNGCRSTGAGRTGAECGTSWVCANAQVTDTGADLHLAHIDFCLTTTRM